MQLFQFHVWGQNLKDREVEGVAKITQLARGRGQIRVSLSSLQSADFYFQTTCL